MYRNCKYIISEGSSLWMESQREEGTRFPSITVPSCGRTACRRRGIRFLSQRVLGIPGADDLCGPVGPFPQINKPARNHDLPDARGVFKHGKPPSQAGLEDDPILHWK